MSGPPKSRHGITPARLLARPGHMLKAITGNPEGPVIAVECSCGATYTDAQLGGRDAMEQAAYTHLTGKEGVTR